MEVTAHAHVVQRSNAMYTSIQREGRSGQGKEKTIKKEKKRIKRIHRKDGYDVGNAAP